VCRVRMAAAWRHTRLTPLLCTPLFPRHTCRLSILALVSVSDPPSRPFSCWHVACTPSCRANPIPSFFPTQARTGSAPWRCCSPPRVPLVIPLHAASILVRCATTPIHQAINAPLLASPPSHPQIRSRACRITLLRQCSGRRSSGAVGKEVVGGRATISSRCSQIYG
jgi:hypothetical protein